MRIPESLRAIGTDGFGISLLHINKEIDKHDDQK